jgi:hypothetical protein
MSTETDDHFPFAYLQGEFIGKGAESIVKELGPDWVIKEVNPTDKQGNARSQKTIEWFRNPDRVRELNKEQIILEQLIGKEHFVRSYFIYGEDQNGNEGYMMVQKRIDGKTVRDLVGSEYSSPREMIYQNREQLMEIVWGVKKAFIELGVPVDFHDGNMIKETGTGRIVLVDCGFPSEENSRVFGTKVYEGINRTLANEYKRIDRIRYYETYLKLSEEEKQKLDTKHEVSDEAFNSRVQRIDAVREAKGIDIKELETERRKGTVEGMVDTIFGDKTKVTGNEVRDYALQMLGNEEPAPNQKLILDKLEKQGDLSQDKSYWIKLIKGEE